MARIGQPQNLPRAGIVVAGLLAGVLGTAVYVHESEQSSDATAKLTIVDDRLHRDGFEGDAGAGAPVPPIEVPPVDPAVCPPPPGGFARVDKTWTQLFAWGYPCGRQGLCERNLKLYPDGQGYPAPLGANRGTYVTVPFVANAGESVNLYFDQVQSRPQIGYNQRPARAMFFTISPCPGDFREIDNTSPNHFLHARCRMFENGGSLIWAASDIGACFTPPGQPLFLNIIPADPAGGIQPGESSCEDVPATATGCDVGAVTGTGPG